MNKRMGSIIILLLLMGMLPYPISAQPTEKIPVIIGFKEKPDPGLVSSFQGEIKYVYSIVPAIAANVPGWVISEMAKNHAVGYIEPDHKAEAIGEVLPWGVDRIDAEIVHSAGNTGVGVTVAIIDTGIDYTHPDLIGKYVDGYDFVNDDDDPMDDNGHGTHCAGIIAALDNEEGVIGVAPGVGLYSYKVLDSSGSGYYSDIISAIEEAAAQDIDIVSMSLGGSYTSIALETACDNALAAGTLLVAAAGNSGNPSGRGDNVEYPARIESVIAVAATDSNDLRAKWSCTGPDVELSAPGVSIYSTYLNHGYVYMSGTSMACPHTAGVAALVFASLADSGLGDAELAQAVRNRLRETADDLGSLGVDTSYGWGLVDADEAAEAYPPPDTTPPVQVSGATVVAVGSTQLQLSWSPNPEPDLSCYNVYRSTLSETGFEFVSFSYETGYVDTGLEPSTTYYYKLTAVDTSGNEGVASAVVSGTTLDVTAQPVMHVSSVTVSPEIKYAGKNVFISASAVITVVDQSDNPVMGAMVYGHWSGAASDTEMGLTDSSGVVSLRSDLLKSASQGTTFTFVIDAVELTGWVFDTSISVTSGSYTYLP